MLECYAIRLNSRPGLKSLPKRAVGRHLQLLKMLALRHESPIAEHDSHFAVLTLCPGSLLNLKIARVITHLKFAIVKE